MRHEARRRYAAGAARLALVVMLALVAVAGTASAQLPRPIERAFGFAGVPLVAVGVVVQETGKPRPLFALNSSVTYGGSSIGPGAALLTKSEIRAA